MCQKMLVSQHIRLFVNLFKLCPGILCLKGLNYTDVSCIKNHLFMYILYQELVNKFLIICITC